jgi:hypothetical protein
MRHQLFLLQRMGSEKQPNIMRIAATILGVVDGGQPIHRVAAKMQRPRTSTKARVRPLLLVLERVR